MKTVQSNSVKSDKVRDVSKKNLRCLKVLVAIASYGEKNLKYLKQIIQRYRGMAFDTDVVVVSDAPKDLGLEVEVVVGLPSRNPWTLPFAHKAIFAERVDRYDLFIYSEDDIGATESHICAFLEATAQLETNEIAGFVRYEVDQFGNRFVNEPWKHYHWKAESVKRRGEYTIAEFTNEHTGFYILTRTQLKRAIASGRFLRGPCRGRYDWPETAATDPYTVCGFKKVTCISHLESFLVHHMPNPYVHQLDVSLESFQQQIQTLLDIRDGIHSASTLCAVESELMPRHWQKSYYEQPCEHLLSLVPSEAKSILSIGCGWGATESRLVERGATVTAIPLDSVIGAVAERRGIEVIYGAWQKSLQLLSQRNFDCIFFTNLLHLQQNPVQMLNECLRLLRSGGTLVIAGPNFDRLPERLKRTFGLDGYWKLRRYDLSGFSICGPKTLEKHLQHAGLRITAVQWLDHAFHRAFLRNARIPLGRVTARNWALQARRQDLRPHIRHDRSTLMRSSYAKG